MKPILQFQIINDIDFHLHFLFLGLIFLIAILYSSVGHGGASGYLALMAIFSLPQEIMRPTALTLNIFVSSIALLSYYKNNHFRFKLLWPFIATSIPFSFLGGFISINTKLYKIILGLFLLLAVLRFIFKPQPPEIKKSVNIYLSLVIGALLGFFSGLIGIGGGIILSPLIIILGWANLKKTAAVSAAFILVNSISGFVGMMSQGAVLSNEIAYMIIAGVLGGVIGSWLGSFRFNDKKLLHALAVVLFFASIKLILL
ncbi:MAG: sulfite exporter TauE/SafE family protein [Bacteroidetes bacterium]|nr:MAG: sulfite exporter TauE/SafE family protein [Bacteroidota bacterium]